MLWFYIILAGLMCTILVNPMFWVKCVSQMRYKKKASAYLKANPEKSNWDIPIKIKKFDKTYDWEYNTLAGAIIAEIIWFILGAALAWIYFFIGFQDVGFLSMLSVMWIIFLFKGVIIVMWRCTESEFEENLAYFITICVIFVISSGINIATPIYEFNNPKELTVNIIEPEVTTMSVDVSKTLETLKFTDDNAQLDSPVYRNGEVIYVLKSSDSYTESPGYVSVKGNEVKFVEYELKYNPYTYGINNVTYIARKSLPDKVFFGSEFSLQKDEDGTIYYACLYGKHSFLRAGKNIEGMVYVNAENGDVTTCTLEEIPSFMTGVAQ